MKAARVHRFGSSSSIVIEEIEKPRPGPGEVLVAVHAAGVGPWDAWIREGTSVLEQPLPFTLGGDLSGVIEALGPGMTGWKAGDEVFGMSGRLHIGASAEYAAAPVDMLARKPSNLTHAEAASVPVVAVTALQMLFDHARVAAGERVLVLGASGSVGAYVVQLTRDTGVHLIGTVRGSDAAAYVRRLGANEVIDVTTTRLEDVVAPVDVVIDLVGGEAANRSLEVLQRGGRLVTAVPNPDKDRAAQHGVTAEFMFVQVRTEPLSRLAALFEAGRLETNVGTVLPLADIRIAHDMIEGKRPHRAGKIVLAVRSDAARAVVAAE